MKVHQDVVDCLVALLRGELGARDQYFLHSRLYEDMGLAKLYERINHEMEEETQHADAILKRILFLEGKPDMRPSAILPGCTVPDMLAADLKLEYEVRDNLARAITLCEKHGDYQTREILEVQLKDTEEDHAYWLEQQLRLINLVGLENYLQSQL
ncbi:MAG: bacterioferritin [Gammaproteobacteria bacterium HGW-Gammaproteobacteria-6]|nr:MAG: bacterioferritin [Gammaproteobacteria bacterium HGW-Gammaproteobacteria-6]